jgi:hypothetical protein
MTDTKENPGPHFGEAENPLTFLDAFSGAQASPDALYETKIGKSFQVQASVGQKGKHAGENVLKFMDGTTERARSYACCWGHRTNCNSQHIDLYSEAMAPRPAA